MCDPCKVIHQHYPRDPQQYRMHCHSCLHCGARLIQRLQRVFALTADQRRERCRTVLADWTAQGHSEAEIRRLAKASAWAVAFPPEKGAKP